jgi:hypothetical protein
MMLQRGKLVQFIFPMTIISRINSSCIALVLRFNRARLGARGKMF